MSANDADAKKQKYQRMVRDWSEGLSVKATAVFASIYIGVGALGGAFVATGINNAHKPGVLEKHCEDKLSAMKMPEVVRVGDTVKIVEKTARDTLSADDIAVYQASCVEDAKQRRMDPVSLAGFTVKGGLIGGGALAFIFGCCTAVAGYARFRLNRLEKADKNDNNTPKP